MNEMGLRQDFYEYLMRIHAEDAGAQVSYFFLELKGILKQGEPNDIFITTFLENGQHMLEDLWFFLGDLCIKVADFTGHRETDRIKLISLKGEAQCVYITKNNFSFQTESSRSMSVPPQLTITIKLENDEVLEFKAAQEANCKQLLDIYRGYLAPLLKI